MVRSGASMGNFFRGWRRKIGCVILLLALLMQAWWFRSHIVGDCIQFRFSRRSFLEFESRFESIRFSWMWLSKRSRRSLFPGGLIVEWTKLPCDKEALDDHWHPSLGTQHMVFGQSGSAPLHANGVFIEAPYSMAVLFLTFTAAGFILSK